MLRRGALIALLFAPLLTGADVNHWQPPLNLAGLLQLDHGKPLTRGLYAANLWLDYAYRPLVYRFPDGTYDPVIDHQLSLDASFTYSFFDWLDVGIGVPVLLRQGGAAPPTPVEGLADPTGSGLGDMRLSARALLLPATVWGGNLAFKLDLYLPTGSERLQTGSGRPSFRPQVLASFNLLADLTLFAGIGYLWQPSQNLYTTAYGDYFESRLGARYALTDTYESWHLMLELVGRVSRAEGFSTNLTGMETFVGIGHRFLKQWDVVVGGAFGTGRQVGTPLARALVGVSYRPELQDKDGDGIADTRDACPNEAEVFNNYKDTDGCPDTVRAPESTATDRDNDGIDDARDMCPDVPEDLDGFADDDGCPETDNDHDGIPDVTDKCPNAAEDRDGFEDDDGCPDLDNDHDGIPDARDKCPTEPETINGVDDQDGCPDKGEAAVAMSGKGIVLLKMVQFETGKSDLLKSSDTILDQVASTLLAHPEIRLVQVEGHTDNRGKAALNLKLSQSRAEAVRRYLIDRDIDAKRLVAKGFGMTQPIADNDTDKGRYANRRVAFTILDQTP